MPSNSVASDVFFTLRIHRGEGMALLAMNWKDGMPPDNFAGFAIEYREPGGKVFYPLKNRLSFEGNAGLQSSGNRPPRYSTLIAPIQMFRWVHFPKNADLPGEFQYRVTPVFMNLKNELSYGVAVTGSVELARETYPGKLNVAFTRGFVSSQAFVDSYAQNGSLDALLPNNADDGLSFIPTHPLAKNAYDWMGFEARLEILAVLDAAIADPTAKVGVVAFDLNLPEIVDRLIRLAGRVRVIIDDSRSHSENGAAGEDQSEAKLLAANIPVKRQHMGQFQHNKTIFVDGDTVQKVVCGSTNFSWRGFYVQSNNALILHGAQPVSVFREAFETYWTNPDGFRASAAPNWTALDLQGINGKVTFSPHGKDNAVLKRVADDVATAKSSIFYSLAFLSGTKGYLPEVLKAKTAEDTVFVAGISDKRSGVEVASGSSNEAPVYTGNLKNDAPSPFREEPTALVGGVGNRMHHKFIVVDFDTDNARVYTGSFNMSDTADLKNGENLLLIQDKAVAKSFMIEAVRIIDHYRFRIKYQEGRKELKLQKPPLTEATAPWWKKYYTEAAKIRDRELFSK